MTFKPSTLLFALFGTFALFGIVLTNKAKKMPLSYQEQAPSVEYFQFVPDSPPVKISVVPRRAIMKRKSIDVVRFCVTDYEAIALSGQMLHYWCTSGDYSIHKIDSIVVVNGCKIYSDSLFKITVCDSTIISDFGTHPYRTVSTVFPVMRSDTQLLEYPVKL